jgi:formate hydrogenlyase transcriptional activator
MGYYMMTDSNTPQNEVVKHLRFERLLTDITASFVNLPIEQIDILIKQAQQRICNFLELDRSVLWQIIEEEAGKIMLSHVYNPFEGFLPDAPFDPEKMFPWAWGQILQGKGVKIDDIENLPLEANHDRETNKQWGIKSCYISPMSFGGHVIGAVSFCSLHNKKTWSDEIVQRLQLVALLFASAVSRRQAEIQAKLHRQFERLVTDISAQFVNLPSGQIDAQIEDAQQRICECLEVDLSALWQWSDESPRYMTVTHFHAPPEGPEHPVGIDAQEAFPWVLERVLAGETIVLDTERMPTGAARDEEMRRYFGVKSSVVIPLSTGGEPIIGVLTFDTLHKERSWSKEIMQRLDLVAQIFANALARKRVDIQLQESQARLSLATDSASVGLWAMDPEIDNIWVTPQTRALFFFDEDEVLDYASFDRMIDPADRARVSKSVQASIASGEKFVIEYRVVNPDGGIRWIRSSGKRILGKNDKAARLMGASIDISERKQMEDQLRAQIQEISDLKQQLEQDNLNLRKEIELQHVHKDIIGRSPEMKHILALVEQVAQTDATVLIEGETGTGKELLARTVHRLSSRKDRPLVTVNCASLPPTLVESELFGREKGAYTGALSRMTGRFEMADKATLFLDEVGELPLEVQAKLLRVLEEGRFERLGSTTPKQVDVRIIAATNLKLSQQVETGRFRKDLYYRLNVFPIHLPPLRERPEDIPPLVWTFIRQYEKKMGRRIDQVKRSNMDELLQYAWPGNVRELRNLIERAMIVCSSRTLDLQPLQSYHAEMPKHQTLVEIERNHLLNVLEQTGWRISGPDGAAIILGLKRTTLQSKMKKLGIRRPVNNA